MGIGKLEGSHYPIHETLTACSFREQVPETPKSVLISTGGQMKEDEIVDLCSKDQVEEGAFLEKVRQEFPNIKWSTHRYLTHGWDHAVLVLDEKTIIRTPKDTSNACEMQDEIRLLSYLRGMVDIDIPVYEYISADSTIAGYKMLPGRELNAQTFETLTNRDKENLAEILARFLTVLHSTPETVIQQSNTREESQADIYEDLRRNAEKHLQSRLNASELSVLARYFTELHDTLDDEYQKVLTHSDLTGEHILWDEQNRRVSIIDFADRSLNDPAIDFAGFFEYGDDFVNKVYSLYGGKKDNGFLHRADVYYKRIAVYIMVDALEGYPCTFEEGYTLFQERLMK